MGINTNKGPTQLEPNSTIRALEEAKTKKELAEANSTEEYIIIRKISTLIEIVEASRPAENRGIGSETTYEPCFNNPHMLDAIEDKMMELINKL